MHTIKDNVLLTCRAHDLPIEFAVYFLAMIEMAGGDTATVAAHPDVFTATVVRVSNEIGVPVSAKGVARESVH